jgi:hypothetical protein
VLGRSTTGRVADEVAVADAGDGRMRAITGALAPGFYELHVSATFPTEATVVTPFVVLDTDS